MKIKHVRPKYVGIFANFSWGSLIIDSLKGKLTELSMNVLEPQIMVKGRITEEDRRKADLLIESIMGLLK
jgi:flavorubredoxin